MGGMSTAHRKRRKKKKKLRYLSLYAGKREVKRAGKTVELKKQLEKLERGKERTGGGVKLQRASVSGKCIDLNWAKENSGESGIAWDNITIKGKKGQR